jgi:hypothetical protein
MAPVGRVCRILRLVCSLHQKPGPSGLEWCSVGAGRPEFCRDRTEQRAAGRRVVAGAGREPKFTQEAWDTFGVVGLRAGDHLHFVRAGESCFTPARGGERTEREQAAFKRALKEMGTWYGHLLTTTVCLTELPPGRKCLPYASRGWPAFELAVSVMGKEETTAGRA